MENRLSYLIKKHLRESHEEGSSRYMFFSNLEQMKRQCELLLNLNKEEVEELLENGHDWAQDHIAESKNNLDQVFDFIMNETKRYHKMEDEVMEPYHMDVMEEGKKKSGTKLCSRGKAAAKSKFKVYPSAYANGWASKWYKSHGGGWRKSKK